MTSLVKLFRDFCLDEGFLLSSAIDIDLAEAAFQPHYQKYLNWIDSGFHAQMSYLERGLEKRRNPRSLFPDAKSVFCVVYPYSAKKYGASDYSIGPQFARYIRGSDYHKNISSRLEEIMFRLQKTHAELKWKVCVDTSAILERSWAALCGLGWIGKNTLLIHPKFGSYFFIGIILTNVETHLGPNILPSYCGNCARCLEGCPTQALSLEHGLKSNKCISYLTIEHRGALPQKEVNEEKIGTWIAGCDICQEVCPFNIKLQKKSEIQNLNNEDQIPKTWDELNTLDENSYKEIIKNSALSRIKWLDFKRNLDQSFKNSKNLLKKSNPV